MTTPAPFGRMLTAMATAFTDDGEVDLDGTAAIASYLVEHGHDGVVVSGTTGEGPATSVTETGEILRAVKGAVGEKATVVAGVGSNATGYITDRLHGTHRGAWLATVLDEGGYRGRRHAEEVKIPSGHGRRWVGIIHVPSGNALKARRALAGQGFAERGTRFVLPLRSNDYTNGGTGSTYHTTARWAANRLGTGWTVVAP